MAELERVMKTEVVQTDARTEKTRVMSQDSITNGIDFSILGNMVSPLPPFGEPFDGAINECGEIIREDYDTKGRSR